MQLCHSQKSCPELPGRSGDLPVIALISHGEGPHGHRQAPAACRHRSAFAINSLPAVTASGGPEPPAAEISPATSPWPEPDAGSAVTTLYHGHYRSLVRLAALLVQDVDAAEALVQDSFVAMHSAWRRLADTDRALAYLHRAVVTRSRSALRHRAAAGTILPAPGPGAPGASPAALTEFERAALVSALRALAPRQREALVLRYYVGLPEAQIASAMRTSQGAVNSHTTQAMSALRAELRAASG